MADSVASIYNYLGNEADRTARNFGAIQQSIIQTRTMQLKEQQQLWENSLTLKKLDIAEKQQGFENIMAQKHLGLQEQQLANGDALEAAKTASYEALTGYRNAQAAKLEATQTAGQNIPYPIGGTPQDYINHGIQKNAVGKAILQSWTGSQESADGAYVPDPNDPLDVETARAYAEQGGNVATGPVLPSDDGEGATDALFGNAGAAAGALGGMRPMPPIRLNPNQKVVAGVAAATAIQTTPKDEFDAFFQSINSDIQEVTNNQVMDQGDKKMLLTQMNMDRMRGAMQYRDNPKAKAFLNDVAPERDAVKTAASTGNEQLVNAYIRTNEQRIGAFNPVLADAAAEGYALWQRKQLAEDAAKLQKGVRDELTSLLSQIKDMEASSVVVPEFMKTRVTQLMQQAYGNPVKEAEKTNALDSFFE